jgi:hypothetical protein
LQKEQNDIKPKQNGVTHQQNGAAHGPQQQNGAAHGQLQQQNGASHGPQQQQQNGRSSRKSNGKRLSPRSSPPSNKAKPPVNVVNNTAAAAAKCPLKFDKHGTAIITAPSWTNFHFDRRALIQQLAS